MNGILIGTFYCFFSEYEWARGRAGAPFYRQLTRVQAGVQVFLRVISSGFVFRYAVACRCSPTQLSVFSRSLRVLTPLVPPGSDSALLE